MKNEEYLKIIEDHRDEYRERFDTKIMIDIFMDLHRMIMTEDDIRREGENLLILNIYEGLNKNKEK